MGSNNRIIRITAILYKLLTEKTVYTSDLAQCYNVSMRTVSRDIEVISMSGVPIVTEVFKVNGVNKCLVYLV